MCQLLADFLLEDCDSAVRQKLRNAIKEGGANTGLVREFTFNRFNVTLDFAAGNVRIEDELDTSERGLCWVSLSDFSTAVGQHKPLT
jgi:hypothetical protein